MTCRVDAGVQALERVQSNAAASTSAKQQVIQPHRERITCDYTLLAACVHELRHRWLPAKVDQVSRLCMSLCCKALGISPAPELDCVEWTESLLWGHQWRCLPRHNTDPASAVCASPDIGGHKAYKILRRPAGDPGR